MSDVDAIVRSAVEAFGRCDDADDLERVKSEFLGKAGSLTLMLKTLGKLAPDERRVAGARINAAKAAIEAALAERREVLAQAVMNARLAEEALDVSLPGRGGTLGGIHPVIRTWERIEAIFGSIEIGRAHV